MLKVHDWFLKKNWAEFVFFDFMQNLLYQDKTACSLNLYDIYNIKQILNYAL